MPRGWSGRVSQFPIRNVIYSGAQDPQEVLFRILLFKFFNRIETWDLLTNHLGAPPAWASYDFTTYNRVLDQAIGSGERIYSAAYIVPNPPFGQARKHGNHLRLVELAMTQLPRTISTTPGLRDLYSLLGGLPSLGPFLAYQYAIDIGYSALTTADENEFVVPGPGALDGISKCFADTGGLSPAAEVITWIRDTSREHFDRLGLQFQDLRGRWPSLTDWQNVFCEVSKYTRLSHPHVRGLSGRTRIKQQFRQTATAIDYRFPPKWGLTPEHTAPLRNR